MFDPELRVEMPTVMNWWIISFLLGVHHTRKVGKWNEEEGFSYWFFLLPRYDCKDWVDLGQGEGNKEREKREIGREEKLDENSRVSSQVLAVRLLLSLMC